ncbi:MAG: OmpH family outer membrane protein [Muribaculaceae bacterium]|nr:OmpH family outer membrane protein [Muribaculaceae bacterium]
MRKLTNVALIAATMMLAMACNSKPAPASTAGSGGSTATPSLRICYIDEDSILNNYNLAKDINEAMLRRQNQFDAAQTQRGNAIQKFAGEMQNKYRNNGYLTEESYNADAAKLDKMQKDAENYLGSLRQSIESELAQSQNQLQDSITNFMKDYAVEKGFDVVLRKSATVYINNAYDATDDVVAGLNKRYVKVEKK